MANKNERLSRTIEYKGKIDISLILSSISTIEKQLKLTHSASVKDSSFSEVNKTIEKLKQLNKTMDEMKKKGFTNSKDFLEFLRMSEKSKELIKQIKSQLGDIKVGALADAAKAAANEVAKYDKEIKKLEASQKNILKANISDKSLKYEITEEIKRQKQLIKDAGTAEQAVNNILADLLDKRKEAARQAKEAYELEKLTYELMKAAAIDLRSFKFLTTSGSTRSVNLTFLSKAMLSDTTGNGLDMNAILAALEKSLTASNYTKGFLNFTTTLKLMGVLFKDSTINLENFKTLFNELNISLLNNNGLKALKEKVEEANEKVKLLNQSVKQLQEMSTNGGSTQLITAIDNTNTALDRRAEALNKANIALENSRNTDAAVAQTLQGLTTAENGYVDSLNRGTVATLDTINQLNRLDSTFDLISNRFKYLLSFMNAWHVSLRAIRQTFNDILNIDKAFASIAMVTDMDLSDLWGQYDEYAKIANELGQSTESVIKSSALYYQLGLDTVLALTLTRDTMKLATLANIDFEQSTKLMTAALRAFHMELNEGAHITDVYSELAANAAADVQGIAYAMSKTSSIAASAGMSFENTAAMLTTMIEVTQEAPENLGTAMKSVIARFTEVKKNVSDIEGDLEDININKVDSALKSVGISLKDLAGQIRDLDQVFLELSAKWNDLDRNTLRYIATIAAGSRQQSRFLALMENYDRTIELIEVAQDSAGRSSEQFAKYADSVENKLNRLKNTWEQFRVNLIDEKTWKSILDFANTALAKFSKIKLPLIAGIATWGLTIGKSLINSIILGLREGSNLLRSAVENIKTKISTGSTKILLLTNITEINQQIDLLKIKLNEVAVVSNLPLKMVSDSGRLHTTIADINLLETELNKYNLTLDATNTKYQFLNLNGNEVQNILKLLKKSGAMTAEEWRNLATVFKINEEELRKLFGEAGQVKSKIDSLGNSAKELSAKLLSAKTWGTVGNAIGSAIGTTAMMAFTGTFNGELIANTIAIQLGSTAVMTAINAASTALGDASGKGFGAAFMAGGGAAALWIAGITASIYALYKIFNHFNLKWKEENDLVYIAQKRYEETLQKVKELSEKLDELNQILEEAEEKWSNVKSADKTFLDLSNKINLTEDELQKLNEATQTLAETMPELISYYDAEGNAVITINENYKKLIKLLEEKKILMEKEAALTNLQTVNELNKSKNDLYDIAKAKIENLVGNALDLSGMEDLSSDFWSSPVTFREIVARGGMYNASEEFVKALLQSINTIRGTEYDITGYTQFDLQSLLKNWEEYEENGGEVAKRILELTRENLIEILHETGQLEDEEYEAIKNRTEILALQKQELLLAANTVYTSMFKEELLKYDDSERKDLMKSMFNNILLNDAKLIEEYNKKVKELGRDLEGQELVDFVLSQINSVLFENISKEVESLSDDTYDLVVKYYNELKNLSDKEKEELIKEVQKSGAELVAADMEALNQQIEKSIQESRKKYLKSRGYTERYDEYGNKRKNNLAPEDLDHALNILQLHSETVFNEVTATAQAMGGKAGDDYIIAMADAISLGNLSVAATMFLEKEIDWSSIDYIHQTEQIAKIAEEMVARLYIKSEEEAIKLINDFIEKNNKGENLGIVTKIKTEADIVSILENVEKAYELLLGKMDSFTVLYTLEPNAEGAIEVGEEEYLKIRKAIEELNEAEGSPYSFNIAKYFDPDGKTVKNILRFKEELNAPLQGWAQLDSLLGDLEAKGENLTEEEKALIKPLLTAVGYLKGAYDYQSKFEEEAKKAVTTYKDIASAISSIASDYLSIMDELDENGFLSSKSLTGLTENVNSLNEKLKDTVLSGQLLDITSILSRNEKGYYANVDALKSWIVHVITLAKASGKFNIELLRELLSILDDINAYDRKRLEEQQKKAEEERQKQIEELEKAAEDAKKEAEEAADEAKKAQEEAEKAEEALQSAREKVDDIYKDIEEKQQAVIEKQEKLNELLYGTGNRRKSTLDGMYNYDLLLKSIENSLEEVNNILEHPSSTDNIGGTVAQYGLLMHSKKVNLLGQKQVYEKDLLSSKAVLSAYSLYYTEVNGRLLADVAKLNAATMNDDIKDEIENRISAYNDSVDKIHELTMSVESLEEEFLNFLRTYRDKYITLLQKVIETLKEQAQEEVNNTKEKYDALAEADNEYVDALEEAIKKQRELRELENSINELSLKEKKLSLLQRDTSGTKKKDVLKLLKDVEKSRQSLVDKNVDNLINNLKDLYKTLKESRDAEIKYMETVLENATYIEEANAVISSWQTADDMVQWFYANSTEVTEMTEEQLEQYSEELTELYNAREVYFNTSSEDFSNMLLTQEEEILDVTTSTAEHLTSEAERAFNEVMRQVDEAIAEAKKDLADAMEAVEDAKLQLVDALNEVSNLLKAVEEAHNAAAAAALKEKEANDAATKAAQEAAAASAAAASAAADAAKKAADTSYLTIQELTKSSNKDNPSDEKPTSTDSNDTKIYDANKIKNTDAYQGKAAENEKKLRVELEEAVKKQIDNFNKKVTTESQLYTISAHKPDNWTIKEYLDFIKAGLNSNLTLTVNRTGEITKFKVFNSSSSAYEKGGYNDWKVYKKGGLVNYTGPAWVDGTPALPEAFLSAEDTKNIMNFTNILRDLFTTIPLSQAQQISNSSETTINVTVNVDSISDDYDVHDAVQRVKDEIVAAANRVGSTVILHQ